MAKLTEIVRDPARRDRVVEAALALLDEEVGRKRGVMGAMIKTAYRTVKGVSPGFLRSVVETLLPPFAAAMEPFVARAQEAGEPMARYLPAHAGEAAEALLAITDEKAERAKTAVVRSLYKKLRGKARPHVEEAMPGVGRLIDAELAEPKK